MIRVAVAEQGMNSSQGSDALALDNIVGETFYEGEAAYLSEADDDVIDYLMESSDDDIDPLFMSLEM